MELTKAINERRSIRSFTDEKIAKKDLEEMVKAGSMAPNGMGRHTWQFTVVQRQELIEELAELIAKKLDRDPKEYKFYKPNALIIVSDKRTDNNWLANCACALQNIFLKAHELGIGSVWINQLRDICDEPEIREFLTKLNIPEDHLVGGMASLGYAKGDKPTKEKPIHAEYIL